jgi:two-component system LytT family sensor kinase
MGIEVELGSGRGAGGEATPGAGEGPGGGPREGEAAPDSAPGSARARRSPWPPVVGFWLAFGLLESAKMVLSFRMRGEAVTWRASLAYNLPWWLVWAALTPAVVGACRALGLGPRRPSWPRLAAHLPIGAAVCLVHLAVICAQTYVTAPGGRPRLGPVAYTIRMVDSFFMLDLLTYAGIVIAYVAWQWYRRYGLEREASLRLRLRAAELERSLVEARLSALRMELNPHFLFNALNSVAGLVRRGEGERAVSVLADLGDLLRSTLDGGRRAEVPLGEELALVERYLAIEGVRFADRLRVSLDVAPEARAAAVPSMILQPLVENALRHGVGQVPGPARLSIAARREGDRLRLSVGDSGPGFGDREGPAPGGRDGIGLSNTRSRLETRYGPGAELRVAKSPLGGAEVSIRLPYATAEGGGP